MSEGQDRKRAGMERTLRGTPKQYTDDFRAKWNILRVVGYPFTSETITEDIGLPFPTGSYRNNCIGALTHACASRDMAMGFIKRVGIRLGQRPSVHAASLMVYQGVQ